MKKINFRNNIMNNIAINNRVVARSLIMNDANLVITWLRNPHLTNINLLTRSIRMTPRSQLFFDKSFLVLYRIKEERLSHQHTNTKSAANKKFY